MSASKWASTPWSAFWRWLRPDRLQRGHHRRGGRGQQLAQHQGHQVLFLLREAIAEIAPQLGRDVLVQRLLGLAGCKWCGQRRALGVGQVRQHVLAQGAFDKELQPAAQVLDVAVQAAVTRAVPPRLADRRANFWQRAQFSLALQQLGRRHPEPAPPAAALCQTQPAQGRAGATACTQRHALTTPFAPSEAEQTLYEQPSAYLRRDFSAGFPQQQKHLVALVLRKLEASSTATLMTTPQAIQSQPAPEGRPRCAGPL